MRTPRLILLVDGREATALQTWFVLETRGQPWRPWKVIRATSTQDALNTLHTVPLIDLVLIDCTERTDDATLLACALKLAAPDVPVIIRSQRRAWTASVADHFLCRHDTVADLLYQIARLTEQKRGPKPKAHAESAVMTA